MDDRTRFVIRILRECMYGMDYQDDNLDDYSPEFLDEYYSRQAAAELLELIMDNQSRRPVDLVEDYRFKMDQYSMTNHPGSSVYGIKYDFATYILDMLLT